MTVGGGAADSADSSYDMHDVFRADGSLLGQVGVPGGARLMDVGDDYVLLSNSNELGVPFVELYGLVKD